MRLSSQVKEPHVNVTRLTKKSKDAVYLKNERIKGGGGMENRI